MQDTGKPPLAHPRRAQEISPHYAEYRKASQSKIPNPYNIQQLIQTTMNYIELINQFWQLRRSVRITSLQADVYFCLLHECNVRGWQNPFEMSNKLLCLTVGIAEPSLVGTRKRLQQLGLIDFAGGKRNIQAPVYRINPTLKSNTINFGCPQPYNMDASVEPALHAGQPLNIKLNKTKNKDAGAEKTFPGKETERKSTQKAKSAMLKKTNSRTEWVTLTENFQPTAPCASGQAGASGKNVPASVRKCSTQHFTPPTPTEVDAYCRERGNSIDAYQFTDFYASKGWMIGRSAMKDWKAAVRTWERQTGNKPTAGNPTRIQTTSIPNGETGKKYKQL